MFHWVFLLRPSVPDHNSDIYGSIESNEHGIIHSNGNGNHNPHAHTHHGHHDGDNLAILHGNDYDLDCHVNVYQFSDLNTNEHSDHCHVYCDDQRHVYCD